VPGATRQWQYYDLSTLMVAKTSVEDIDRLYELIQAREIGLQSLVWDDGQQRWLVASDHEFFRRIREIAAAAATPAPVRPPVQPWAKPPVDPPKLAIAGSPPVAAQKQDVPRQRKSRFGSKRSTPGRKR
jgi:hypothetical protein